MIKIKGGDQSAQSYHERALTFHQAEQAGAGSQPSL